MNKNKCTSRSWLDINLKILSDNFKKIQQKVRPAKIISVLKANAYGLGVKQIAETLKDAGANIFAVAELREALELLPLGNPVMLLGGILESDVSLIVANNIITPITDYELARVISKEAVAQNKIVECHFLLDTGMGRLGCIYHNAEEFITKTVKLPNLNCCGIYSHFPIASNETNSFTEVQIKRFCQILENLKKENIFFQKIHIANSAAINNFPAICQKPFNLVRTGINLHGSFDDAGQRILKLKPTLTLKAKLISVRKLKAGMSIGYDCTQKLTKDTIIGTVAIGYADGVPIALSNKGFFLNNNISCPIIGKISMDYTTISLEECPEPKVGDDIICLGGSGNNTITVADWAQLKATNNYDIICSFGKRVERRYIQK